GAKLVSLVGRGMASEFAAVLDVARQVDPLPDAISPMVFMVTTGAFLLDLMGQLDRSAPLLERAHAIVGPNGEREPIAHGWLCCIHGYREAWANEDPLLALRWCDTSQASFRQVGHRRDAMQIQVMQGMNLWFLGALDQAERELRDVILGGESFGM